MTCDRTNQIHAFHDDELSPADREALELHLKVCPACRTELVALRGLSRRIEEAVLEPMPARLVGSILSARRVEVGRTILRISSWMTAVAATVLVGALMYGSGPSDVTNEYVSNGNTNSVPALNWETVALAPPTDSRAESGSEIALVAQWMSDGLSSSDR